MRAPARGNKGTKKRHPCAHTLCVRTGAAGVSACIGIGPGLCGRAHTQYDENDAHHGHQQRAARDGAVVDQLKHMVMRTRCVRRSTFFVMQRVNA